MGPRARAAAQPPLDVIVLGAGAAGLAAARDLSHAGLRAAVLEARPRAGGRILTRHDADWPLSVELGAEFLHGRAKEVRAIADSAGLAVQELPDLHLKSVRGRWQLLPDFYEQVQAVMKPLRRRRGDLSFADYLRTRPPVPGYRRGLARLYVEGYHAAHLDRVSACWLAAGELDGGDEASHRQYRLPAGYDAIVRWLRAGLDPERVTLHLNTVAREVVWGRGFVTVQCRTVTGHPLEAFSARALIVTVPLGVLKAPADDPAAIRFAPPLTAKREALSRLEVGQVCKVVLRFRDRFWEDERFLSARLPERAPRPGRGAVGFWHDGAAAFPTWWTAAPLHVPVLTGWAGGPAAEALLAGPEAQLLERGLDALASIMRVRRAFLEKRLEAAVWHDWRADPCSRGAYSYAGVGGAAAAEALARPLAGTLFFAGEATHPEESGTVQGALASGRRAARELIGGRPGRPPALGRR